MSDEFDDVKVTQQLASMPPSVSLGINVEKPKFPQYAIYSKRLESFELWPEYLPVDKEDLVEAGLVYTGVGDSVRCYFCGGGLRNWVQGDVPMEEHAKWYPKCPHILLVKGQAFVDKLCRGEKPDPGPDNFIREKDSVDSTTDHLESVAVQSCVEMGFSKEMVGKAVNIFIGNNGKRGFKARDLCEILFELEDSLEDQDLSAVEDNTKCSFADDNNQSVCMEDDSEPLEELLEENHRLKENQQCKICLDNRADVIFLPCGHMVSCPQCAPVFNKCPICRKRINGQMKAFFAVTPAKQ